MKNQLLIGARNRLLASTDVVAADLTPKQKQLDVNKDGKISGDDLKKIREGKKPTKTTASNWKKDLEEVQNDKLKAAVVKFGSSFKIVSVGTDGYNDDGMYGVEVEFEPTTQAGGSYEMGLSLEELKEIGTIFKGFEKEFTLCLGEDGNFRIAVVG